MHLLNTILQPSMKMAVGWRTLESLDLVVVGIASLPGEETTSIEELNRFYYSESNENECVARNSTSD